MAFKTNHSAELATQLQSALQGLQKGDGDVLSESALKGLDKELENILGVNPIFLFAGLEERRKNIDADNAILVAEILLERAQGLKKLGRYWESSLHSAIDFAFLSKSGNATTQQKGNAFLAKTKALVHETKVLELLFRHFEEQQRFALAEEMIFDLIQKSPDTFLPLAEKYYEKLSALNDKQLEDGNLPRQEVEEAIQEIQEIKISNVKG